MIKNDKRLLLIDYGLIYL